MAFMDSNLIIANAETITDGATGDTTGYITMGALDQQVGEVYINAVMAGAAAVGAVSVAVYNHSAASSFASGTLMAQGATFAAATVAGTVLLAQKVSLAEYTDLYIGATTTSDQTETATVDIWLGMEPAMNAGVSIQNEPS